MRLQILLLLDGIVLVGCLPEYRVWCMWGTGVWPLWNTLEFHTESWWSLFFSHVLVSSRLFVPWQIEIWKLTWSSSSPKGWIGTLPRNNGLDGALDTDLNGLVNDSAVPGADFSSVLSVLSDSESNQNKNTKPSVAANEFSACIFSVKLWISLKSQRIGICNISFIT